jgi:hypothetical protein
VDGEPTVTENVTDVYGNIFGSEKKITTLRTVSTSTPKVSIPYIEGNDDGSGGTTGSSGGSFTAISSKDVRIDALSSEVTGGGEIGGGGKTSPAEKIDKTKKSDVVERYKEVDDAIDDLTDSINDANKATDRLFGTDKIKALETERDLLKKQIPLLEKKRDEAKAYLAIDKQLLADTGKKYGITFETDGAGNIINYTE